MSEKTDQLDKLNRMMTASQLGLTDLQWRSLVKVLEGLEQGLIAPFDLDHWPHCIHGWCNKYGGKFSADADAHSKLFYGHGGHYRHDQQHAAHVIREFLFTGEVNWQLPAD